MRYLALVLLLTGCANTPRYSFTDGPPRAKCSPETPVAQVGQLWHWTCIVEGNLKPFDRVPIVIKTTQYKAEEFPTASIQGLGLQRMYMSKAVFSMAYYLVLRGKQPYDPWNDRDAEVVEPGDPRNPLPPIGGVEDEFDGEFWLKIEWFEVRAFDGEKVTLGKKLTEGTVRGRLDCMTCAI